MPSAQRLATSRHAPVVVLTDSLEKPPLDVRDYRVVRLGNGLVVLLAHDPQTDKASAALDVNVGCFSDEDEMPGMAHALEHVLFMGTAKFPVENDFSQYLSANSGDYNAYTAYTSTNYYFDVAAKPADDEEPSQTNPSPLLGTLDRFAQFFIEPLFSPSTLDRELQAVDSENQKNLQNDEYRLQQLDKCLANPNHPFCHFPTGNIEVLKTIPESRGINIRDKFIEFHAKHYSANRMKLVVLGREPLDVLQNWVVERFSSIENKNLDQNRWTDRVPFRPSDLGTQCFAKPVIDSRALRMLFPFMDEHGYESPPSEYISHLVGHEGPGSIMACIKSKGWAHSFVAGPTPVCPGSPDNFEVRVGLTEEGLKHYTDIVKIFFQYIAMLREYLPQEWIFQEQKHLADIEFKFRQKLSVSDFTSRTSSLMQTPLDWRWLLRGHSGVGKFDPSLIAESLEHFRPENMRIVIVSRDFPGDWDKKETWYGTEYRHEKIPAELIVELKKSNEMPKDKRLPELHLPQKNNFIPNPDKLEVEKKAVTQQALAPRVLCNDQRARLWWKKDDTFWVPKANVMVSLKNPIVFASAENYVKARLFTELIRDALEGYSYDAELAGLQYTVMRDERGLFLDISGYNDKLPLLLEQVVVTMRDIDIKDDRFKIIKEHLQCAYNNWLLQPPSEQIGDYMSCLNAERDYPVAEMAKELENVSVEAVRIFRQQMLSQLYIEVYAHGNMDRDEAIDLTKLIVSALDPRDLPRSQWPIIRSLILPRGSNFVYKKTLEDDKNLNHCIETFFYVGHQGDCQARAKTRLIEQMIQEPAFDQLRTKEQLGYIVFSDMRNLTTTFGLRLLVQSEKTPEYLDRRIEAFLKQFGEQLQGMSEDEFKSHKRSLIIKLLKKLDNLKQESSRHWEHIESEDYDFEQNQGDAALIEPLTKSEMIEFYNSYFHPSSTTRARLSVHLKAQGAGKLDTKVIEVLKENGAEGIPQEKQQSVHLLRSYLEGEMKMSSDALNSVIEEIKKLGLSQDDQSEAVGGSANIVDSAKEISDVRDFKAGLWVSSGAKPVKQISEFEETDDKP
ncbi:uncharacterized protein VB005_02484 [Metarhizium brunneum]